MIEAMCGRFARRSTRKVLEDWFGVSAEDEPTPFEPTYNAAPQSAQPVVRLSRDSGQPQFALMRWGLVPYWAKDAKFGYTTFNARAEELVSKAAFREAIKTRRCLVPADVFYEWQKLTARTRVPFAVALRGRQPYAFAGLWEKWKPKDGAPLETFTIVTTDANELVEGMHDRMPVILAPQDYNRWLEPGDPARPPTDLLRPFPAEKMEAWPVSQRVGNVKNDDPTLLDPVKPLPSEPTLFS